MWRKKDLPSLSFSKGKTSLSLDQNTHALKYNTWDHMALPLTADKAITVVIVFVVLNIYFAFIDEFYYIDRCYTGSADKSKLAGTLDKYRQAHFFSIYFLSVMVVPTLAIGSTKTVAKRLFDFVSSYLFRYAVYLTIVHPLGNIIPYSACLTKKSISGHTHMYTYHIGLALHDFCLLIVEKKKATSREKRGMCSWASDLHFFLSSAIFFCSFAFGILAIRETYVGGYHSPRHIIQGFIVGIETIMLYIMLRNKILMQKGLVEESVKIFIK